MKHFIAAALSCLSLLAVSCYGEKIEELSNRVDKIENERIATIQEQVASISTSILDMQRMDTQLQGYITALQTQTTELERSLSSVDKKIEDVESELKDDIDAQKVQILATLGEYKTLVSEQLKSINTTIAELQEQKVALENQIKSLKDYIDGEIQDAEDWASATFATLENYNALAAIVSGIQAQIETLNSYMTDIDATVKVKVSEELATATAGLRDSIKEEVEMVAKDCSAAINSAKEEITAAYKAEIKSAIATSEVNMKSWVNTQLSKFYTATQMDSKLSSLKNSLESQLESQKTYLLGLIESLEQTLTARIDDNNTAIDELNGDLSALSSELAAVARNVTTNASAISANAASIRANAKLIAENAKDIEDNADAIEANTQLINTNKKLIEDNNTLIKINQAEIKTLKSRATTAEAAIAANAEDIADNAADIATNASLIAQNATAISNNGAAIAANAQEIENLKTQLQATKEEITGAYKAAISTAIATLDGKLSGQVATEVETLNSRIDAEVATINAAIVALTARVAACEKDIKTIKTNIYNIQTDIEDIQEQIATILSRIQSFTYVPKYSDGRAAVSYTNNGTITPGNVTLDFNVLPSGTASELAKVWQAAISAEAVYTITRSSVDIVPLTLLSVVAEGDYLTMVVSGEKLSDDFYLGRISANLCVKISDGNNERKSEYISLCPWTTDVIAFADPKFKTYLLENFDANSDGEISEDEALDVTEIDCSYMQITSLSGIEYFTNLTSLNASYNRIETLDLRNNSKLTEVDVMSNLLTSLHVEGLSALELLDCSSNKLAELNVTASKDLKVLNCSNNKLGALNVLDNKDLVELNCSNNTIAQLNLKNNVALETLNVRKNALSLLDVTKHVALKDLDCSRNSLTSLNVYSNTLLETLRCSKNQLKTLDVRHLASLSVLDCSSNNLSLLDVTKNAALTMLDASENAFVSLDLSRNTQLKTADCSKNADLTRVWVKDENHSLQINLTKDDVAILSYNNGGIMIPDANLKNYMLALFDDDEDGEISIVEAENVQNVNCSGRGIADITGLESCPNLKYLNFSNNSVVHARLPYLAKLETVVAYGNPLETLDLNNDVALTKLYIINVDTNALSGTAVTVNGFSASSTLALSFAGTKYTTLNFTNSSTLASYDFTENIQLTKLVASGNKGVKATDVSTLTQLTHLDLRNCDLEALNVDTNLELVYFDCSNNKLTALSVDNNVNMVDFNCSNNKLSSLRISNNTLLEKVQADNNTLSNLNVRQNRALKHLNVNDNTAISALALTYNTSLEHLYASRTSLTDIDLSANTIIKTLTLAGVATMDIIDLTKNTALVTLDVSGTSLSVLDLTKNQNLQTFNHSAGLNISSKYSVGKVLTVNGVKGVVFELNGSKNKIVSCLETKATWGASTTTSATNTTDGMENMKIIVNKGISSYPAFKWCRDLGVEWYLPASGELKAIYNVKTTLNSALSSCGGTTFGTSVYWSSAELDNHGAYTVGFSDGDSSSYSKSYTGQVRAVRVL